jgi:hypothetical protein
LARQDQGTTAVSIELRREALWIQGQYFQTKTNIN